ncbi:MAG: pilus assembly protein PilM [bacterium]
MFTEIFFPEKIGSKRLLSKKIISFSIQDDIVKAAVVFCKGSQNIVQNLFKQKIEFYNKNEYKQKTIFAIKTILQQIKKYDQIKISIPSSSVIFKELTMPFANKDKIRMILDYEIEPLIPFPIEEAVSDFIITKQIKEKKSVQAQILVAIARKEDIQDILDLYYSADVKPNGISVDLISTYSIYQQIPEYNTIKQPTVLIDMQQNSTQIAFLQSGQLRITRFITTGIQNIVENLSSELNQSKENIETTLFTQEMRTLQQNEFDKALQKQLMNLFSEIQFTLNSFSSKLELQTGIGKIFLLGASSKIKGLPRFVNNLLQIPTEKFNCEKIFDNKIFKNKVKKIISDWNKFTVNLGTAAPSKQQTDFDLQRKEFSLPNILLLKKQIKSAIIITLIIFITIGFKGYNQINNLKKQSTNLEKIQLTRLRSIFPKDSPTLKKTNFRAVLKDTEKFVNEKTEMWAPFAKQKLNPLEILQELTRIIDKRRFDVTIEQISMEDVENETVKIEVDGFFKSKTGSKHFDAFEELEKRFAESGTLKLTEVIDARPTEDEGIKFNARLVIKEM